MPLKEAFKIQNYEELVHRFKLDPASLGREEVNTLYYGKLYSKYTSSLIDSDYRKCLEYFSKRNFKKAIVFGEKFLAKDPINSEIIAKMNIAYDKEDPTSVKNALYTSQFKVLTGCILSSGDGKTQETPYIVNAVGEEYLIGGIMQKDLRLFRRKSIRQEDGVIDEFSKREDAIYFKVLYNAEKFK